MVRGQSDSLSQILQRPRSVQHDSDALRQGTIEPYWRTGGKKSDSLLGRTDIEDHYHDGRAGLPDSQKTDPISLVYAFGASCQIF